MKVQDALTRFSDRVEDYIKYRPGYPAKILEILRSRCGLNRQSVVADIGSGPGNFARLFVESGREVFAVEPNLEMRVAGLQLLGGFSTYHSIDGKAEETHLPDVSVDFITAAQAFHWFDWPRAKTEFRRILHPGGSVVLVWNDRRFESSPFLRDYEQLLLQFGTDYADVKSQGRASVGLISDFFSGQFEKVAIDSSQLFDFDALKGRLFSASYAPQSSHPNHEPMLRDLQSIFQRPVKDGKVAL